MKLNRRLKKLLLLIIKVVIIYILLFSIYKTNFYEENGNFNLANKEQFISFGINSLYEKHQDEFVLITQKIATNSLLIFTIYFLTIKRASEIFNGFSNMIRNQVSNLNQLIKQMILFYIKPLLIEVTVFMAVILVFISINKLNGKYTLEFYKYFIKMYIFYINLPIISLLLSKNISIYLILLFTFSIFSTFLIWLLNIEIVILVYIALYIFIYNFIKYREERI